MDTVKICTMWEEQSFYETSITSKNQDVFGNCLHFKFLRVTMDDKEEKRTGLVISAR